MNRLTPESWRRRLLALFALSGFCGLIYESIWSHYLRLMLGHAAYAQTLVLAIFMGGMALGAWVTGRYSERWRNPLMAYALVEALVGLSALCFHDLFVRSLDLLYLHWIPGLSISSATVVKWLLAAAMILPQSILLGTTFPLMSAAVLRRSAGKSGETLALLYFFNSIGAVVGVLASGFLLIPWGGLPGTIALAGLLNLGLAGVVWFLLRRSPDPERPPAAIARAASADGFVPALLLGAAFATGAASFFYEIGWIRMLSLVLGTTTHAFELMLSAFILGLALGGLWIRRRLDQLQSPLRFAGHVQILMGSLAVLTLPIYVGSFDLMGYLVRSLEKTDRGYLLFHAGSHVIALAVMLPATLMAGMTLPLFTFALLKRGHGERSIGRVYAANTVGAILGVLLAVHWIMPAIGTKGLVVLGGAADIALGQLDDAIFDSPRLRRDLGRVGIHGLPDLEIRRLGSRASLHPVFAAMPAPANSDFHPFLSHRAPRSHFLGEAAVEITRLHVAPVPVLELLDTRVRRGLQPVTENPVFTPSVAQRWARELLSQAQTAVGPAVNASRSVSNVIPELYLDPDLCVVGLEEAGLLDSLLRVAATLNPFLADRELQRFWLALGRHECYSGISPYARTWLELHTAVAARDARGMTDLAAKLLASRESVGAGLPGDPRGRGRDTATGSVEVEYLVAAGLSGALAQGQVAELRRFESWYDTLHPPGQTPPLHLQLLLDHAAIAATTSVP